MHHKRVACPTFFWTPRFQSSAPRPTPEFWEHMPAKALYAMVWATYLVNIWIFFIVHIESNVAEWTLGSDRSSDS